MFLVNPSGPVRTFKHEVECHAGNALRLGWMRQGSYWTECQGNKSSSVLLAAGLYIAAVCLSLQGVIGFRCGCSINNLPAVAFDDTLLLWWKPSAPNLSEWCHCFMPGNQFINIPKITGEPDAAVVQFLLVDMFEVMSRPSWQVI